MNKVWIIFILLGGFVIYAYFGFGGEQIRSNVMPQNNDRKETGIDIGAKKNNTAATIKPATMPTKKATTTESQPTPKNKSQ